MSDKPLDEPSLSNVEYCKMLFTNMKTEIDNAKLTVSDREKTIPLINRLDAIVEEYETAVFRLKGLDK